MVLILIEYCREVVAVYHWPVVPREGEMVTLQLPTDERPLNYTVASVVWRNGVQHGACQARLIIKA